MSRSFERSSGHSSSNSTSVRAIARAFAEACVSSTKNSRFWGVSRRGIGPALFTRSSRPKTPLVKRPSDREVQRAGEPGEEAVDGERDERPRLEEPHQEAHREVRGHRRAERADECLAANAVPVVAEELRELERGRGADDRRREQEREAG